MNKQASKPASKQASPSKSTFPHVLPKCQSHLITNRFVYRTLRQTTAQPSPTQRIARPLKLIIILYFTQPCSSSPNESFPPNLEKRTATHALISSTQPPASLVSHLLAFLPPSLLPSLLPSLSFDRSYAASPIP